MFVNNVFEQVKQRSDIIQVAEHFSIKMNRNGFACCPFHKEKTASMSIDKNRQIYKCFGCGKGGDVIALVQELLNCTPYEAAKQINLICNCGINFERDNKKPEFKYQKEFAKFKADKTKQEEMEEEMEYTYHFLYDLACSIYRYWRNLYIKTKHWNIEYMSDELAIIYKNKDFFNYLTEVFDCDKEYIYKMKDKISEILERGIIFMDFERISMAAYREEEMPKGASNIELITYYRLKEVYLKHYNKQITEEQGIKEKERIKADYEKQNTLKEFNDGISKRFSESIVKSEAEVSQINNMIRDKKPEKEILDVAISCISNLLDNPLFLQNYKQNY